MQKTIHLEQPKKDEAVVTKKTGLPTGRKQRPGAKFVYAHYPQSWLFDEKRGFLPDLRKVIAKAGVNGVDDHGSLTHVMAGVASKGGIIIDPKDSRLGEYVDYVRYYDTQGGGRWYVDFCQTATVLPTGKILWASDTKDQFRDFLLHIRDAGMVQPMIYEFYVKAIETKRAEIDRLYGRLDRNPHLKAKVEAAERQLKGMEKHWNKTTKAAKAKAQSLKMEVDNG